MNAFSPVISVAAQLESQMVKMLSMVFLQLVTFWGLQFVFSLWCPLDHITGRLRVQFFSVDFFIFLNTSAVVHETWKTSKTFINRLQCWQTHYYFSEKKTTRTVNKILRISTYLLKIYDCGFVFTVMLLLIK